MGFQINKIIWLPAVHVGTLATCLFSFLPHRHLFLVSYFLVGVCMENTSESELVCNYNASIIGTTKITARYTCVSGSLLAVTGRTKQPWP